MLTAKSPRESLIVVSETNRQRLLETTIKDSLGDFAVSMLEDELAIMRGD